MFSFLKAQSLTHREPLFLFSKVPQLLVVSALVGTLDGAQAAETSISVKVKPTVCLAPCQPTVAVTVNAPKGSPVCAAIIGESYESRSCWSHEGYKVTTKEFKSIPTGNYQVIAAIRISECEAFTNRKAVCNGKDSQAVTNLQVVDAYGLFTEDGQP